MSGFAEVERRGARGMTGRIALRSVAALMLCGAALLTAGCAGGPSEPVATPEQFLDREPLPSCGEVELGQGEEIPDENLTCLGDAAEEGAELSVTRPTTEGDPVTEYYRVLPGDGWEAYIDGTEDRHGGQWWYTDCPDADVIEDLATCTGKPL
jgi:hypothetical protein